MSNKTDFQAKNTRLNANNTDLSSILETINNLPEASSGGGKTIVGDIGFGLGCVAKTGITTNNKFKVLVLDSNTFQVCEELEITVSPSSDGNYYGSANTSSGGTINLQIMPFSTMVPGFVYDQIIASSNNGSMYFIEMN